MNADEVRACCSARGTRASRHRDEVARAYYPDDPARQAVAKRYLRDNIQYFLGDEELEGLRTFYRYAAEASSGSWRPRDSVLLAGSARDGT